MSNTKQAFHAAIDNADTIEYSAKWENGTGYFDFAIKGAYIPKLAHGQVVQSVAPAGRRIGIIGTTYGNVVIFDRYTDPNNSIVVYNMPTKVSELLMLPFGALTVDNIEQLFGDEFTAMNIGIRIEELNGLGFKIGETTTCQLGNPTDSGGFEAEAIVIVLGRSPSEVGFLYLIKVHGKDLVGRAHLNHNGNGATLICTAVMGYGKPIYHQGPIRTMEAAVSMIF